jgi:hypothetical protein
MERDRESVCVCVRERQRERQRVCVCVCVWKRERENLLCSCACISVTCLRVRKGEKWIEFLEGAFAFASAFAIHFFVVVVVSMTEGASAYKGGKTSLLCIRLLWCKHEYVLVQSESLPSSSLHPHLHEKLISFLHYVFSTSLHALTIIKFSLLLTRNEKKITKRGRLHSKS